MVFHFNMAAIPDEAQDRVQLEGGQAKAGEGAEGTRRTCCESVCAPWNLNRRNMCMCSFAASPPPTLPPQVTCLKFHGNRIVSGSDDSTLKVWHATTGKVSQP